LPFVIHADLQDPVARALRSSLPTGTVLAAVSGGPDSMAMFHALCELAREREGLRVIAAHFDHRLRADSHRDVEAVEHVAAAFGVRIVRGDGDVAAHADASRQSIETAAREMRYAFLERAADDMHADVIATAHTRSDHIETVMMRILRGADARGLRGISARRGRVVRPLLGVTRAETLEYCETRGVPYVVDPSNADARHFRNRVRHEVLPSLRQVYPGLDAALERCAEAARVNFEDAELATRERLAQFLRADGTGAWTLSLDAFDGLDPEHGMHLISRALDTLGARDDVSQLHYRTMIALRAGASLDLPGLRVRREYDALVFTRRDVMCEPAGEAQILNVPGCVRIGDWVLTSHRDARPAREESSSVYLAASAPLTIRLARPGDRIQPFGMSGHKKLSDLFTDRKVPYRERARTPVVECEGEILWVAGVAASERTRLDPNTAGVIRLTATRAGTPS
jgi:tRNA(Ile)-lysidine synthase